MPALVAGIHVFLLMRQRRGWPGHLRERACKTRFALLSGRVEDI
jgi:hypothetical protein